MLRITLEYLPHGDEDAAVVIGVGKVCNLRKHEAGSDVGDFHAYFEANEPPMASCPPPYVPGDPRSTYHTVGTAVVEGYPRRLGSAWDLVATMLNASGRGRPVVHGGLTLSTMNGGQP